MAAGTLASRSPFRAVAHELLNPLASLRGCVEALGRDDVPEDLRGRLVDIVRRQSERLDWLIRAAVADVNANGDTSFFDASRAISHATSLTGATTNIDPSEKLLVHGDPHLFRLGIEALLMAMTHGGAPTEVFLGAGALHVTSPLKDPRNSAICWKIDLARAAFHRTGIRLRLRQGGSGLTAIVSLPDAPRDEEAST